MRSYHSDTTTPTDKRLKWQSQKRRILESLTRRPQTRLEVSVHADVPLQNVCRLVSSLKAEGKVRIIGHKKCSISGMDGVELLAAMPPSPPAGTQIPIFQ